MIDIHICKICWNIVDPLPDGVYIICKDTAYQVIIRQEGRTTHDNMYSRDHYTIGEVLDEIMFLIPE